MFRFVFIILSYFYLSDAQLINGISDPCPAWTEWAIGPTCVMPNTLGSQVLTTCPSQYTVGRRRRQLTSSNSWWSKTVQPALAPPTPIPTVDDKRRPFGAYGYGGYGGYGSYGGYGGSGYGSQSSFWSTVASPCGRCAIQFRCRTRSPTYACSPTSEIERAPCGQGTDLVPCQAPINLCPGATGLYNSQTGYNTYPNTYQTGYNSYQSGASPYSNGGFNYFNFYRGANASNIANSPTNTATNSSGAQWWARKINRRQTQWTKVSLSSLTTGDSISDKRHGYGGYGGYGGFGQSSAVASPQLNCQQSATGCQCCCAPFNPVNGQCV